MLAAPFLMKRAGRNFICQRESGTHFLTGKVYEGGQWYEEPCGYLSIPVFVKETASLQWGAVRNGRIMTIQKDDFAGL